MGKWRLQGTRADVSMEWKLCVLSCVFFQAEDGIRDLGRSRGRGDVYKRQLSKRAPSTTRPPLRTMMEL